MTTPRAITWEAGTARRLTQQFLRRPAPRGQLVEVVRAVAGLQGQVLSATAWILGARVRGLTQRAVYAALWEQRRGELWTRIEKHFHTPELRARTIEDHAAIVDALAAGDPDAARAAMQRHLARVAREFQRRLEPGGSAEAGRRGGHGDRPERAARRHHEGGVSS